MQTNTPLEEAARAYDMNGFGSPTMGQKVSMTEDKHSNWIQEAFKAGAAWQKLHSTDGLSLNRATIATACMQGALANPENSSCPIEDLVVFVLKCSDALIAAL